MVRQHVSRVTLALVVLLGARPAAANPITFTGFVDQDFNPTTHTGAVIIPGNPQVYVAQPAGVNSGWNIQGIGLSYDKATDTLSVGVQMYNHAVAGDADNKGLEGQPDPTMQGGQNPPNFGLDKSIAIGITPNGSNTPLYVAGIPADKSTAAPNTLDHFTVAKFNGTGSGLQYGFGQILNNNMGSLAFDPSKAHPDLEFTIAHFSQLPGINLSKGFGIQAYAGSLSDVINGEDFVVGQVPGFQPEPQTIPEPATLLGWSLVTMGTAWNLRRRRRCHP